MSSQNYQNQTQNPSQETRTRMTRQRQIVLEEVRKVRSHPTADEVYEMVRLRLPKVSLGTVYRNLDRLSREGLINIIEGPGQRRYDGKLEDHVHLRCTACGAVFDLDIEPIPLEQLSAAGDFEVSDYRVEFLGLCGECKKARIQDPESSSQENDQKQGVER